MDENPSARYKQTGCTGQTGYTVHILDEIIDKSVRQIFSKMRGIPKEQIITRRYEREVVERKNYLQTIQVERDKAQKDLISLKAEILACIKGESVLPKETLAEMITAQEEKLRELDVLYESSYAETEKTAELMDSVSKLYEELISFSDLYDSASFEAKKMIVNQLIRRVEVYRGYQLNITFNFDLTPYSIMYYVFCILFSGGFFLRHFELLSISIISMIYRYILSFSCSDILSTNCTAVRYFSVEPNLS